MTTAANGTYRATGFLTGSAILVNVTAPQYLQYYVQFTPSNSKTNALNITLRSTNVTQAGLGIGGITRTGSFAGLTITGGFGEPISNANVTLQNVTNGNYHYTTTNMAGWYLADEGESIFLVSQRPYEVWGSKAGFSNSTIYTVVAP